MTRELKSARVEVPDSLEAVYDLSLQERWGDGLPIVPPTEERVNHFLERLGRDPGEVIGKVGPLYEEATVENIVVNCVAAGCRPEYVPVVIAAVEAMIQPEFYLWGVQGTSSTLSPVAIINGPIRQELNINSGHNCLGQGWRANATIGRAIRLILNNIGGGIPGDIDKATLGQPAKYTFCFGENEEASPWEPLHVERGFSPEQSTVTMHSSYGVYSLKPMVAQRSESWAPLIADAIMMKGGCGWPFAANEESGPIAIVTPAVAQTWAQTDGLSKRQAKEIIWQNAWFNADELHPDLIEHTGRALVVDGKIRCCHQPEDIMLVVAGAGIRYHAIVLQTGFGNARPVTKAINPIKG
ncbi:MAG: hypothetical protein ABID87_01115 [Chloroflexota bacterium]